MLSLTDFNNHIYSESFFHMFDSCFSYPPPLLPPFASQTVGYTRVLRVLNSFHLMGSSSLVMPIASPARNFKKKTRERSLWHWKTR